jgi:hypothetical protein
MAFVIADRVRETTTTTGTGTITLGGAVTNFETFTANLSNSDTTYYAIVDNTNGAFEVGLGTFTASGTTLARSVLASSNSNNLVDFGAGTKDVFITVPASKIVVEDGSNNVAIGGTVTATAFSGSGAGLTGVDVVNDTSPQLGGDLDAQGKNLEDVGISFADSHAGINGNSSSPVVFTVTVAGKSGHPYQGEGSGNAYLINGLQAPALTFHGVDSTTSDRGYYYRFDQSDSSNGGHPLRFYLDAARSTQYTTGVTTNGTAGSSGAYTQIDVDENTPKVLYYQCTNHGYMGNYAVTLGSRNFGDGNITNVGDISLDSISPDGTDINVAVSDNSATAFTIKQGSDSYLIVDTANSSESVAIGTGVSGTAISIGHTTSETTVNDNLTVTGDLTVSGTTTTVDSTTINVQNTLVFEGSTANEHETTLTTVDPTADRTISLPNQSGTLPVLAAASTTQITSTPEELNLLDGVSGLVQADFTKLAAVDATATELNLLDGDTSVGSSITIADSDGIIVNDGGTMKSVPASDVKTYAAGDSASKGFATAMAIAL